MCVQQLSGMRDKHITIASLLTKQVLITNVLIRCLHIFKKSTHPFPTPGCSHAYEITHRISY